MVTKHGYGNDGSEEKLTAEKVGHEHEERWSEIDKEKVRTLWCKGMIFILRILKNFGKFLSLRIIETSYNENV